MSDLLIRGVEMPKSCYKCDMRRRDGMDIVCPVAHERFSVNDVNILEYRLDNCPLFPVPAHGRLIDALYIRDTIIQKWMDKAGDSHMYKCGMEDAYEVIRNAPTIIPASEEYER